MNIHTATFPAGAIRGQLLSSATTVDRRGDGHDASATSRTAGGGSSGDSIVGNVSVNTLSAAAPATIGFVGGPGARHLSAATPATDVLIWNNGDGSDLIDGGADGDAVRSTAARRPAMPLFVGTRAATSATASSLAGPPYSLDIGTTETLIFNGRRRRRASCHHPRGYDLVTTLQPQRIRRERRLAYSPAFWRALRVQRQGRDPATTRIDVWGSSTRTPARQSRTLAPPG